MQAELNEQLTTLRAANISLEASLTESRAAEARLTQDSAHLNAQLQEHGNKHQQLQKALLQAEEQYKAQAAELAEAMVSSSGMSCCCSHCFLGYTDDLLALLYLQAAWSGREDELLGEQQSLVEQVRAQTELNDQVQEELKDLRQQVGISLCVWAGTGPDTQLSLTRPSRLTAGQCCSLQCTC